VVNISDNLRAWLLPYRKASGPITLYDAHTLPEVLDQAEAITDCRATCAIVDRGYLGRKSVDGTEVLVPGRAPRGQSRTKGTAMRKRFRRRAAIEPVISHLKADLRRLRCFLKGFRGDQLNLMLAAAAWNFRKWMRRFTLFWLRFLCSLVAQNIPLPLRRLI